jgi:hypothetical protein
MVSPVRQNVPVRCLPRRPTAADVARLACTRALLGKELPPANAGGMGFAALINRSRESMLFTRASLALDRPSAKLALHKVDGWTPVARFVLCFFRTGSAASTLLD